MVCAGVVVALTGKRVNRLRREKTSDQPPSSLSSF
jgi:hypothetical protein